MGAQGSDVPCGSASPPSTASVPAPIPAAAAADPDFAPGSLRRACYMRWVMTDLFSTRSEPRDPASRDPARSEEHTSELQSLMRISYAVFCLKKKTKAQTSNIQSVIHTTTYTQKLTKKIK